MNFFKNLYNSIVMEIKFRIQQRKLRKKMKELRKRDPFIYK